MTVKFRRETKVIFTILALIIIGAAVFIVINYNKLKQSIPVSQNLAARAQVKAANVPIEPRGK